MRRALFVYVSLSLCACGGSQKAGTTAAKVEAPPNESAVRLFVTGAEQLEVGSPKALVRAKELLQKALALDPRLWEAHYDLGLTERKLGDLDAARASLLKARELAPDASEPLLARAGRYADRLSINVELPSEQSLGVLAPEKDAGGIRSTAASACWRPAARSRAGSITTSWPRPASS